MTRLERLALSVILYAMTCAGTLHGQGQVAIDTVAVRQLADAWKRQPGDTLACVAGHWEGAVPVLDSVLLFTMVCPRGTFGMLGFVYDNPPEEAVLNAMRRVLDYRPDVTLAGEVHAVIPVPLPDGRWVKAPLVYGAFRQPAWAPDTRGAAPASADSLWRAMLACSGAAVQPGGDLADVVWVVDPARVRGDKRTGRAVWLPPDTIVLHDLGVPGWVLAHELLHHLLRGPPDNAFTLGNQNHPMNPFALPCRVMPFQNSPEVLRAIADYLKQFSPRQNGVP